MSLEPKPPPNTPTDLFVGNIFGYISVSLQIIYFLPILILLYRSKSIANRSLNPNFNPNPNPNPNPNRLSHTFLFLEITSATSSLIYGCLINETPLLLSNAINVFFMLLILITKSFNIQKCINQSCHLFSSRQNHIEYRRPNNIFYSINETESNSRLLYDRCSPRATPMLKSPELPQYDTLSKSVPIEIPNGNKKYWNPMNYNRNKRGFENRMLRENENGQSKSAPEPSKPRLVFEPIQETPTPSPETTRTPTPMPSPDQKLISPTNPTNQTNLLNKNIDEIIENNFTFKKNKQHNQANVYPPDPENLYQNPN